jgi:DNA-directed RNA polymerase subunit beta
VEVSQKKDFYFRKSFAKIQDYIDVPDLLEVQRKSYNDFLQREIPPHERKNQGLQLIFNNVFPIEDYNDTTSLEFVSYELGVIYECKCGKTKETKFSDISCPKCKESLDRKLVEKYSIQECIDRDMTYSAVLRANLRLVLYEKDRETKKKRVLEAREQEVFLGEFPLMTPQGTFVINGTERVVVSQLHRSPGIFFHQDKDPLGKPILAARIIPYRGSWVEFEIDANEVIWVRIDRKKKIPATVLLKALGMVDDQEILEYFLGSDKYNFQGDKVSKVFNPSAHLGYKVPDNVINPATGQPVLMAGKKITKVIVNKLKKLNIEEIPAMFEELIDRILAKDVIDPETGEIISKQREIVTQEILDKILEKKVRKIEIIATFESKMSQLLLNTLAKDTTGSSQESQVEAQKEIYRKLRPGDPLYETNSKDFFSGMFFDPRRYDLSSVGRLKFNQKLGRKTPLKKTVLESSDFFDVLAYLMRLHDGQETLDDIDHLSNRRVRRVGELVENQIRIGLVRMEKAIKEKMSIIDIAEAMPQDIINSKPISAIIREFFGTSQLSQFMDQTNPLAEITHKRRLSALGPGGLSRERAGFEVRDVHPTHYGRICPIETPEGPNIGLITSLSTYARINEYGFIETPYLKVTDGRVTNDVFYMSAYEEDKCNIAQANALRDTSGFFTMDKISARVKGNFLVIDKLDVEYIDVSTKQLVSVAASLIPFLEHDDANRALMGSNMQRQAVPLLQCRSPLIGTGMEKIIARDSGTTVHAQNKGVVKKVDANRILIQRDDGKIDIYDLIKFRKSNQNTCINQKPIVYENMRVEENHIIADGPSTDHGELALGKDVLVAFMSWRGYNFEDAIIISEKLVREDKYTSVHIEEFVVEARDTKLGKEDITRDIPNVSQEALKELDLSGIIRIGANVKPGDILVGKITPKAETVLSPEEKLLKAIFGEKAGDVRDASLVVPPGIDGIVIDVKIFNRKGVDKSQRSKEIDDYTFATLNRKHEEEREILENLKKEELIEVLKGKVIDTVLLDSKGSVLIKKGTKLSRNDLSDLKIAQLIKLRSIEDEELQKNIEVIYKDYTNRLNLLKTEYDEKSAQLTSGDDLPLGVIKMVKVYIALKRKLSVGDKMAGRHGNKGVLAKILPIEDMPFMPDGTPTEIVLNPLGVPSRMNVGQILEAHIGWACKEVGTKLRNLIESMQTDEYKELVKKLEVFQDKKDVKRLDEKNFKDDLVNGLKIETPVFNGAKEDEIKTFLELAGCSRLGKITLYDGITGDKFDQRITVGYLYMMKLAHLVDDKIHARSIGPYSLVTQQPLGGKAQFGGQRFGEMEVWALEAYGAASILQEVLTVKSDDVSGRTKIYEAIVKGDPVAQPGLPESFNILVKELQSLALNVELIKKDGK